MSLAKQLKSDLNLADKVTIGADRRSPNRPANKPSEPSFKTNTLHDDVEINHPAKTSSLPAPQIPMPKIPAK